MSGAVYFLPCGPVPAWFVDGVARALGEPCLCGVWPGAREGHAASCRRGRAWDGVMRRARQDASGGVNEDLTR